MLTLNELMKIYWLFHTVQFVVYTILSCYHTEFKATIYESAKLKGVVSYKGR